MGTAGRPEPSLLMLAAISRYEDALAWAVERLSALSGPPLLQSGLLPFGDTDYYRPTMGDNLRVQLSAFGEIDPGGLAAVKLNTNRLEADFAAEAGRAEARPLNLDPGYLSAGKFVLATTKDASHRIYLRDGIFGEVTLHFSRGAWRERDWTYPNYRREDYKDFLLACRKLLLAELRSKR